MFAKKNYMSQNMLLPNRYKKIGWYILIPSAVVGIVFRILDSENINLSDIVSGTAGETGCLDNDFFRMTAELTNNTILGILVIAGGLLVSFSKEKVEDEFVANLRQSSLMWAVFVNYVLLIFCFAFLYGEAFFEVMIYNMFTVLIIFIIRFNYILYRNSKNADDEK